MRNHYFFIHISGSDSFPITEPVSWCLEHARDPLLARARQRLLLCDSSTDPQRILNVVYRRCGLNLAEVRSERLTVHFWTELADLRPFCKRHCLTRAEIQIITVRHKNDLITVQPGSYFSHGEQLDEGFPWREYRERWMRRHERQPDDREPAQRSGSAYSWEGMGDGQTPWAALKSIWRRDDLAPACPNCDMSLEVWAFNYRRCGLCNMCSSVSRCCFGCRCFFREETGYLWPWLVRMLDADLLPRWHHNGYRKMDLRPRGPAPVKQVRDVHDHEH